MKFTNCIFNSTNELISNATSYIISDNTNVLFSNCSFFDLFNYWAIFQSFIGELNIINCSFVNCKAVQLDYSQCIVQSSQFINGTALNAPTGSFTVFNSSFVNNTVAINAMNIYVYNSFFDSNIVNIVIVRILCDVSGGNYRTHCASGCDRKQYCV